MTPLFFTRIGFLGIKTSCLAAIVLSVAFVVIVMLRIIARDKTLPWTKFDWASLIELFGVFFAIWFSVYSIEQANATVNDSRMQLETLKHMDTSFVQTKNSLDTMSAKLKQIPVQLDQFSNSLGNLNKMMENQQKYFSENVAGLNRSISGLKQSISSTSDYIDRFSSELKQVVTLTDKQLKIWEGQQEIVRKEYSRKPNLSMIIGQVSKDKGFESLDEVDIINKGDLEAEIKGMYLNFAKCEFDTIYCDSYQFKQINSDTLQYMNLWPNEFRTAIVKTPFFMGIMFRRKPGVKQYVKYTIEYYSKYEKGTFNGVLEL